MFWYVFLLFYGRCTLMIAKKQKTVITDILIFFWFTYTIALLVIAYNIFMLNLKKSYHEFLRSKKDPRKDLKLNWFKSQVLFVDNLICIKKRISLQICFLVISIIPYCLSNHDEKIFLWVILKRPDVKCSLL